VKVGKSPAEGELIVSGSIGWLKVAVTAVPVTTLSLVFVLVGTFVAMLLGLDEVTVGSAAAPIRLPGATAANTLPIPPPASNEANSMAVNTGSLHELSNLVIFFPSFVSPQGAGVGGSVASTRCGPRCHNEAKPGDKLIYIDHSPQLSRRLIAPRDMRQMRPR
jgi:hypothetical protein